MFGVNGVPFHVVKEPGDAVPGLFRKDGGTRQEILGGDTADGFAGTDAVLVVGVARFGDLVHVVVGGFVAGTVAAFGAKETPDQVVVVGKRNTAAKTSSLLRLPW